MKSTRNRHIFSGRKGSYEGTGAPVASVRRNHGLACWQWHAHVPTCVTSFLQPIGAWRHSSKVAKMRACAAVCWPLRQRSPINFAFSFLVPFSQEKVVTNCSAQYAQMEPFKAMPNILDNYKWAFHRAIAPSFCLYPGRHC